MAKIILVIRQISRFPPSRDEKGVGVACRGNREAGTYSG